MAGKSNIRSIRFSDALAEQIDQQAGRNFTEKYESLVTRCMWELPGKEAELERIQKKLDEEKQRLRELERRREELERLMNRLQMYMIQETQRLKEV